MSKKYLNLARFFMGVFVFLFSANLYGQNFGTFASAVHLTVNGNGKFFNTSGDGTNIINPDGTQFTGNLGSFSGTCSLILNGGEVKTFKSNNGNVCNVTLKYTIVPTGSTLTGYKNINLNTTVENCVGNAFPSGGPCGGNDQKWNSTAGNENLTAGLPPGAYTLAVYYVVNGGNSPGGCEANTDLGSEGEPFTTTFTVAPPLMTSVTSTSPVCAGSSVNLNASTSGGTGEYSHTWTGPNGFTSSSPSTTTTAPGTYTYTVTDGCDKTSAQTTVIVNPIPLPPTLSGETAVCVGATTTLTASECSGTVTWSTGATGGTLAAGAGTYTATCTVDGCTSEASASITVTEKPVAAPTLSGETAVCVGATTTLTASECSGTVTWSTGATGGTLAAGAGTYTATCTVDGCTSEASASITVTEKPVAAPTLSGETAVCVGATTTLTASECSGTVTWSTGATGGTLAAGAGTYTATCTVDGCTSEASASITVTEKPVAAPTLSGETAVCVGATTTLTASECSGTVTWSTGATGGTLTAGAGTYTATCTVDGCTSEASASITVTEKPVAAPTLSGETAVCVGATTTLTASECSGTVTWSTGATGGTLTAGAGTYTATCTVDGCTSEASASITVTEKPVAAPTLSGETAVCVGATTTLTASECSGTVTWSTGATGGTLTAGAGTYTATCTVDGCTSEASASITVTEKPVAAPTLSGETAVCVGATTTLTASECSGTVTWSTGATGGTLAAGAGTYTATCTVDGCTSEASASITVTEKPVAAPTLSGETAVCVGATTTLTASECSGTVTWSTGATGGTLAAGAGTYTATCTVDGCTSEASASITVTEKPVAAPTLSGETAVCVGATTTLTASECSGTVTWSTGATGGTLTAGAGTYTATCTVDGCTSEASASITVTEKPVAAPTLSGETAVCVGATTTLTASECSGTVTWSTGATGGTLAAGAGTYTATCTVDGCTSEASASITVTEKPVAAPTLSGETAVCVGATTTLTASECSGTVTWSTGATGGTLAAGAGTYTATCTVDGCTSEASASITVTEKPVAAPTLSGETAVCVGATTTLTASECSGTVTWSTGATGGTLTAGAGAYTATCTVDGCTSEASASITVTEKPVAAPTLSGETAVCVGATTTLTASECSGTVTWSTGATGGTLAAGAGTYTATCTVDGCTSEASASITVTEKPVAAPTLSGETAVCVGATTTLTASECSGTVTWSTGATGGTLTAGAGAYTATCTVDGCTSEASASITVTEKPVAAPTLSGETAVCVGATTTLTASECSGTVTWSTGATGGTLTAGAGTYTATCTVDGCTSEASASITVTEKSVTAPTVTVTPTKCPEGEATLTASECSGTVTWSTGATGGTLTAGAGTYTATCTVDGCTSKTSAPVIVAECSPCPQPPVMPPPPPSCSPLLINGSFEDKVASNSVHFLQHPGWKNEVDNGLIETWRNFGAPAVTGSQLVELNAYVLGTITQDVTVQAGVPINFSYFHRSRGSLGGERIRAEIVDLTTNNVIHTLESTGGTKSWKKFQTTFVPTSNRIQVRIISLNSCGDGDAGCGNLLDAVSLNYSACECAVLPSPPAICSRETNVCNNRNITLTATSCPGGTVVWSNGQTGPTLTTNVPGKYTAKCVVPGNPCESAPSNVIVVENGCTEVSVTCPTFQWRTNGVYHVKFCVKNNGTGAAAGTAYFKLNGKLVFTENYTNLAPGQTKCYTYRTRFIPCGSQVMVEVGSTVVGTDLDTTNNTCTASKPMYCVPKPPPYDPNYKDVIPKRSLEGGIFVNDEWLTYTIHCRNDGKGIAHDVIMVDTIDVTKLDINTIEILSSMDTVKLRRVDSNIVAFDFMGVDLTSSFDDLPNSQTEVVFKIKRLPGQEVGTEIENKAGIYFDHEAVVETNYASSIIIAPCDTSLTKSGKVLSDRFVTPGGIVQEPFVLSNYDGIITGWQTSTDPTFKTNTKEIENYSDTLVYTNNVGSMTYIRALVQTGGCAIAPSEVVTIYPICGELVKNGSFETPVIAAKSWTMKGVPNWTNVFDNNQIEVHSNLMAIAPNGKQYIELNGYARGNIYQDIPVIGNMELSWSLKHKARTATNNETIIVTLSAPDGTNAKTMTHVGSLKEWQTVSSRYKTAPGQTTVRFRIKSTVGGSAGAGNFIDDVTANYAGCNNTSPTSTSNERFIAEVKVEVEQKASMTVRPNPAEFFVEIDLKGFDKGATSVSVINSLGRLIKTANYNYTGNLLQVNLSDLPTDVYLIAVQQGLKVTSSKVIVNR